MGKRWLDEIIVKLLCAAFIGLFGLAVQSLRKIADDVESLQKSVAVMVFQVQSLDERLKTLEQAKKPR